MKYLLRTLLFWLLFIICPVIWLYVWGWFWDWLANILKGALDIAYEYELANLNTQEKARLVSIEDGYHNLAKPKEEKGKLVTKIIIGTEIEDTYGIFLTGEYSIGGNSQNDYRTGITLKAVF